MYPCTWRRRPVGADRHSMVGAHLHTEINPAAHHRVMATIIEFIAALGVAVPRANPSIVAMASAGRGFVLIIPAPKKNCVDSASTLEGPAWICSRWMRQVCARLQFDDESILLAAEIPGAAAEAQMLQTLAGLVMGDLELRMKAMTAVAEERQIREASLAVDT